MRRFLPFVAMTLLVTPALAQNPQAAPPANPTVPIAPPNAPTPPPEKIVPHTGSGAGTSGNRNNGTMSDTLSRQRGTIAPPNVDPGITVQPPRNGASRTPIIPPPGSPGGGQNVVPK